MVAAVVAKQGAATVVETAAAVMAVAMGVVTVAPGVVTAAGTEVVAAMATAMGMEMEMEMEMAERIPASLRTLRIPATCRCPIWIRPSQAATSASGLAA